MPIYEYKCTDCAHTFSKLIRNDSELPDTCPECGQASLKKLFSTFSASVPSSTANACPAARECPSGGCCGQAGGGCPL